MGLVEELCRCLAPEDGELPLEPLPELPELTYSGILGATIPAIHLLILLKPARTQAAL